MPTQLGQRELRMSNGDFTIWVAILSGSFGLLGTFIGGCITYAITKRTLTHQERVEWRERELTRFEGAYDSMSSGQIVFRKIYENVRINIEMGAPWAKLQIQLPTDPGITGKVALVLALYAPHLSDELSAFVEATDEFTETFKRGALAKTDEERRTALDNLKGDLDKIYAKGKEIRRGLAKTAQERFPVFEQ